MTGYLVLEDGTVLEGESFGYEGPASGEVVFTTSMVGYPEALTDPSYNGQILTFTYPLVGNYGVPKRKKYGDHVWENFESDKIWAKGVIVSQYIDTPSHFSSVQSFGDWLKESHIPALGHIDTRALTLKLREKGVMMGKIVFDLQSKTEFVDVNKQNLVAETSIRRPILYTPRIATNRKPIVLFDCGVKHSMIRDMVDIGCTVLRVPWNWKIPNIHDYSGYMLSNGPGDPMIVEETIEELSRVLKTSIPIFGICLGNQVLALAAGGKTYKLRYGHRASNQPVKDTKNNICLITTQNHGFAVDGKSLPSGWDEWFVNLNDGTNEGIRHKTKPHFTIQFHAEANPGPNDATYLFKEFSSCVSDYEKSL